MKTTLDVKLRPLHACAESLQWAKGYTSATKAWRECQRGDCMLWLVGKQITSPPWSDSRKPLLACCLDCAETVKHLWPKERAKKIIAAIGVLREWIAGTATIEQAKDARQKLYDDAAAVYAAAAAAAREKQLMECATIVRRHYPKPPKIK